MNEHTEKNINEAIDWLQQTGGSIQDFATTQAPLYCQEVVAWTFWIGLTGVLIGSLLLSLGSYCAFRFMKDLKDNDDSDLSGRGIVFLFSGLILFIVGSFTFGGGIADTIKAKVAPRIVIVEHLRGLNK